FIAEVKLTILNFLLSLRRSFGNETGFRQIRKCAVFWGPSLSRAFSAISRPMPSVSPVVIAIFKGVVVFMTYLSDLFIVNASKGFFAFRLKPVFHLAFEVLFKQRRLNLFFFSFKLWICSEFLIKKFHHMITQTRFYDPRCLSRI